MLHPRRAALFALGLALTGLAVACSGAADSPPSSGTGEIVTPTTDQAIRAQVASVSVDGAAGSVQIAFLADEAATAALVAVTRVVVVDAATGTEVHELAVGAAGVWNGSAYVPWNQRVTPGGDLKASYALSSAGGILPGDYGTRYRLRVTLQIDGVERTLESEEVQQEPPMAT